MKSNMNLFNEFFKDKVGDKRELLDFGVKNNILVEDLLSRISNRTDFLATIIELRFGMFFDSLFYKVAYDKKAFRGSNLTPDWTITTDKQAVIAEVFRLNASKFDQDEIEFGDKLMDILGKIQEDYYIQLDYDYSERLNQSVDFECIYIDVADWLKVARGIGDKTILFEISFEVVAKNRGSGNVVAFGNFTPIKFDYRRLSGRNSRLFSKLKYAEHAWNNGMPFVICMHLSFESWFKPEDVYEHLYGASGEFLHSRPFGEYYPRAPFHDISRGLYYSDEIFRNQVSGVLVRYQNDFTFFPNYSISNRLDDQFLDTLKPYLYKKLTV
ncbi:MAG: hypothetical protein ACTHZG_08715 [Ruoffia tabacinasalis]